MAKIITAKEAAALITDRATLMSDGFLGNGVAEEVLTEIETRFLAEKAPRDLTFVHCAAQGDAGCRGANHLAHAGLLKRVIGGHFALAPKVGKLAVAGEIEGYNFPQGIIAQMIRAAASGSRFYISRTGLHTFVDPAIDGGKLNSRTKEDIVERIEIDGAPYLKYNIPKLDFAILRGTTADADGNISMEREANTLEATALAMACKQNGGTVIVQVERTVPSGAISPHMVRVPSVLVDYIVLVSDKKYHMQTFATQYDPSMCGEEKKTAGGLPAIGMSERKIIARRAFLELQKDANINLGIGLPEGVPPVAEEEGALADCAFSVESGVFGGLPASGLNFGASINVTAIIDQPYMFDFYQGGGLTQAFLGLAQADQSGNINVSRFGSRLAGCGGFIDITQNTKNVYFLGTMTNGGLEIEVKNGELKILREGKNKKFVNQVEQVTFSGAYANRQGQRVKYITERCVFELTEKGLMLTEVAPGIDLKKDILDQMEFRPAVADGLATMDHRIFFDGPMKRAGRPTE